METKVKKYLRNLNIGCILFLLGCVFMMTSCTSRNHQDGDFEKNSDFVETQQVIKNNSTIIVIEKSEFINFIGRIFVISIQEHYYIYKGGANGYFLHAESCPKIH